MTPRVPTANEKIEFLAKVQTLLYEGQFVASYKFALLIAPADLAIETPDNGGREIPIEKIAEKFVSFHGESLHGEARLGRGSDLGQR